jgi:hypothetical protein
LDDLFEMIAVGLADLFGVGPGVQVGNARWADRAARRLAAAHRWAVLDLGGDGWEVRGDEGRVRVHLWVEGNEEEWALRFEGAVAGAPPALRVAPAGAGPSPHPTGDAALDAVAAVLAPEAPWWPAGTREAVRRAVVAGVTIGDGAASLSNEGRTHTGERGLAEAMEAAVAAVRELSHGESSPRAAAADPDPGVRRRALEHLARSGAEVDWSSFAADPAPSVSVFAASQGGDADALRRLLDGEARGEALLALVRLGVAAPAPAVDRALVALLAAGPSEEWIRLASELGGAGVVPALRGVRGPRRGLATAAVKEVQRRLGEHGAVSLAGGGDEGALSEVDVREGGLSTARADDTGRRQGG